MMRPLRALCALALLIAAPAPALAQSMQFATNTSLGRIIAQTAAVQTVSSTTAETQVLSATIPANSMGANGRIEVRVEGTYSGANGNRTINIYFGGTLTQTLTSSSTITAYMASLSITNRNATGSQRWKGWTTTAANNIGSTASTTAIDTTADQTLSVKIQLVSASDSATLESAQVILYPKG